MKKITKIVLAVLIVALCVSPTALAAVYQPNASYYLSEYDAYIVTGSGGNLSVWFDVTAVGTMDQIGALTINLREYNGSTWRTVKSFSHADYSNMLVSNDFFHTSSVSYAGIAGRSYYASVTVWAGKNGGGDSRVITTDTVVA